MLSRRSRRATLGRFAMLAGASVVAAACGSSSDGPADVDPAVTQVKLVFAKPPGGQQVVVTLPSGGTGSATLCITTTYGSPTVYAYWLKSDNTVDSTVVENYFRLSATAPSGSGVTVTQNATNLFGSILQIPAAVTNVPITLSLLHTSKGNATSFGPVTVNVSASSLCNTF